MAWGPNVGDAGTLKRVSWACNTAGGCGNTNSIELAIHDALVGSYSPRNGCYPECWPVLDYLGVMGFDWSSLSGCQVKVSEILGIAAGLDYVNPSTDEDCSDHETRLCTNGTHGSEDLLYQDASGGWNNWEACCIANDRWYLAECREATTRHFRCSGT